MDNPKISVLIPMYNRKHYIEQCVDSALNQTFQEEYEIIIRDDCSTDGVFELVQEKYAQQISEGKIRLYRNKKRGGEGFNTLNLINDSVAKYIAILHNDDMYLPHALKHLYEVAENTNADVVHESFFLNSPKNEIINDDTYLTPTCWENSTFDKIKIMSDNPFDRFKEWLTYGTFIDSQYNLFNRDFVLKYNIFKGGSDPRCIALWWIMEAKVLVKTPIICYIHRDAPDSTSNTFFSPQRIKAKISDSLNMLRNMDKRFAQMDFFKNNEYFQYIAKAHVIYESDNFRIFRNNIYANGITFELYEAVAEAFKKHFGDDYFYPMFWFNWLHVVRYNLRPDMINFKT